MRSNFVAARLDETENCLQQPGNLGNVGLYVQMHADAPNTIIEIWAMANLPVWDTRTPGGVVGVAQGTPDVWTDGKTGVFGWHGYYYDTTGDTLNALDATLRGAGYPRMMSEVNISTYQSTPHPPGSWMQGLINRGEMTIFYGLPDDGNWLPCGSDPAQLNPTWPAD
jgi:hypothetical protein